MTPFEKLFAIADEETLEKLRHILTKEQIALALAHMLSEETGLTINQTTARKVTGESSQHASGQIAAYSRLFKN